MEITTESGAQLFLRLTKKLRRPLLNLSPEILPTDSPKLGEIIEISGPTNIGKTLHLMELIARTIIPQEFGGKEASVIIIDTNSNFHVPHLMPQIVEKLILHHRMSTTGTTDTEQMQPWTDNNQTIVLNSMKRIIFFKCYTSIDFELVLLNCADILFGNRNISLLAIDSIATFYWCDMSNRQQPIRMETYLKQLQQKLRKFVNDYGIVAIYTKPNNFGYSNMSRDEPIEYKIKLQELANKMNAQSFFENQQMTRNYIINNFGIEWISSQNK